MNLLYVMMEWVQLTLATITLAATSFAQFNQLDSSVLSISLSNSSNDLETTLNNFNLKFKTSAVSSLLLRNVDVPNGGDFFTNNTLGKFSTLETLHLEKGKIKALPENSFRGWNNSKTKTLNLIDIGLENITKSLLEPISVQLFSLNVSYNKLTYLPNDVFEGRPEIVYVDISHNKLDNLSMEIFKPIGEVKQLYLQNNQITSLEKDIFFNQTQLAYLDLSFNNIQYVHKYVFSTMENLVELKMSGAFNQNYNSTNFPSFENLSLLWDLRMDRNNFETLPEDIFSGLKLLELLNLSNNKIHFLATKTFEGNRELRKLNLKNNQLKCLDNSLFNKLEKLEELNLADNQLTFLGGEEVFNSLSALSTLTLDNNRDVQLANSRGSPTSILFNCTRIKTISARNTSISEIYEDWFASVSLKVLDLRDTPVTKSRQNFTFQSEVTLKLSDSNKSFSLSRMILLENNGDAGHRFILDTNQECGENCSCVFHIFEHENKIELRCKHFGKETLNPKIPELMRRYSLTRRVEFIMSNASIENVDVALIAKYLEQINVKKLSLSHNKLTSITPLAGQLSHLEELELDNNKFEILGEDVVDKLKKSTTLKSIRLHGNPWICNCSTRYFVEFVANYSGSHKTLEIPNSDDVRCSNNEPVKDHDVASDCDITHYNLIAAAMIIATIIVMCSILLVIYYRYELDVKIWMYHHSEYFPSYFFSIDESLEQWKPFDAFVCYAKEDEWFVKTQLRPKLEDEDPKFRLCIHQRDWDVGKTIPEQINDSVTNSRRTLVVLSHNFLNSDWCKREFQVARDRSIHDKIGRIIVIMLEDIAHHRLTDELKAYITKYTYIPWQDNDWFWNKLRYVLPHKVKIRVERLKVDFEIPSLQKESKFWLYNLSDWLSGTRRSTSRTPYSCRSQAEKCVVEIL